MTSPTPTPGITGRFAQASLDHTLMDRKGVGVNLISQTYHLFQNELSTVGSAFKKKKERRQLVDPPCQEAPLSHLVHSLVLSSS